MNKENREQEIKNNILAGMQETFLFQTYRINRAIVRKGNKHLQDANLPLQLEQFPILMTIHTCEGLSQQEIADLTRRDKSSIQRTLTALHKKGLIKIMQDENDKRRNLVFITDEGRETGERIKGLMKKAEQEAFSILSDEERNKLIDYLKSVADKLENN
jgi:DNA-binding MarR family transcriptional regulator